MSEPKFTPGPWAVNLKRNGKRCIEGESGRQVCMMWNDSSVLANSALIACAPEMYEMLDNLQKWLANEHLQSSLEIRGLLAKARGEA